MSKNYSLLVSKFLISNWKKLFSKLYSYISFVDITESITLYPFFYSSLIDSNFLSKHGANNTTHVFSYYIS